MPYDPETQRITVGVVMMVAGMGVTLATLIVLGYIIRGMSKLFPYKEKVEEEVDGGESKT